MPAVIDLGLDTGLQHSNAEAGLRPFLIPQGQQFAIPWGTSIATCISAIAALELCQRQYNLGSLDKLAGRSRHLLQIFSLKPSNWMLRSQGRL